MISFARRRLVKVNFFFAGGEAMKTVDVPKGHSLLQATIANDIDVEGACGGQCACATCHVILEEQHFKLIPKPATDEADMLDLGAEVTRFSRLGCQVKVTDALEGMNVTVPSLHYLEVRK